MKINLNTFLNQFLYDMVYKIDEWKGSPDHVVLYIKDKLTVVDVLKRLKESFILKRHGVEMTVKLNTNKLSTITVNGKQEGSVWA